MRSFLSNRAKKIALLSLPLIILGLLLFLFKPSKYFVIDKISSINCEQPIISGTKLEYLNNKKIDSIEDFENAIKSLQPNQTFFLIVDNKIVRCLAGENFSLEIKEIQKEYFNFGINFNRILIENNEKTRKYLNYLGFNNYIYDSNWLVLPYDSNLINLLESSKNKKISFYYESELEKNNESVTLGGKEMNINELKDLFDDVEIKDEKVIVRKLLFDENSIEDFSINVIHLTFVSGYYVNLNFKINKTKINELNELLQITPIRLINLERFYNANFTIYFDNNKILDLPLPYTHYYNQINFTVFNLKNYQEIQKLVSANLLESYKFLEEKNQFKIFTSEIVLLIISILALSYYCVRYRDLEVFKLLLVLIPFSFSPLVGILSIILLIVAEIPQRKVARMVDLATAAIISLLLYLFINKTYFSIFLVSLSLIEMSAIEMFVRRIHVYKEFLFTFLGLISLLLYFFNPLISFSLIVVFASIFYLQLID